MGIDELSCVERIILPAAAWFGGFFGRKRFSFSASCFLPCLGILRLANSLGFLIFAR